MKNEDDIDCRVLHLSDGASNEFTMAFPKCVGPKSVRYDARCKSILLFKKILLINYRAKHPVKVHVWAGRGRTGVCIFGGIMRAPLYVEILKETLLS